MRPLEMGPVGTTDDTLIELPRTHWLEPVPDAHAIPSDCDPHEEAVLRESIRLAFVAAMQHLAQYVERASQYAPTTMTASQEALVDRYVAAFEAYDVTGLTALMREDATRSIPPYSL